MDKQEEITQTLELKADLPLSEVEKKVIVFALQRQNYNRTRTAKVLGIGIRTLQRKIKQYRQEGIAV